MRMRDRSSDRMSWMGKGVSSVLLMGKDDEEYR
jgi:hypothetical protein